MQPLGKKGLFFRDFEAPSSPNDPFYQRACFFFGGGKGGISGGWGPYKCHDAWHQARKELQLTRLTGRCRTDEPIHQLE